MKFGELEGRMRVYETSHDQPVLPGVYIVARMDRLELPMKDVYSAFIAGVVG